MLFTDQILYEDNHLIAINKRCGQIVQGDKTGDETLPDMIKAYLKERDGKPGNVFCGVIHRIDRPVSGVVLFAKTSKALSRMTQQLHQKTESANSEVSGSKFQVSGFRKTYWALCKETPLPPEGRLENWLGRDERNNKAYITQPESTNAKLAILDYKLIGSSSGGYNLIEINLHTGRHHQIRAQLANIGCHIKGDLKYGAPRSNHDGGISLHARSITFIHPVTKEEMTIVAPVPKESIWEEFDN